MTFPTNWRTITGAERGFTSNTYVAPLVRLSHGRPEGATHVCLWYNTTTRDWVVSLSDADGNQIGSSEYVYGKADAVDLAEDLISGALRSL